MFCSFGGKRKDTATSTTLGCAVFHGLVLNSLLLKIQTASRAFFTNAVYVRFFAKKPPIIGIHFPLSNSYITYGFLSLSPNEHQLNARPPPQSPPGLPGDRGRWRRRWRRPRVVLDRRLPPPPTPVPAPPSAPAPSEIDPPPDGDPPPVVVWWGEPQAHVQERGGPQQDIRGKYTCTGLGYQILGLLLLQVMMLLLLFVFGAAAAAAIVAMKF